MYFASFADRVGRILTPKEVAMATVEGVLTNDEIVYVPRLMKFQMALSAYVFPIKKIYHYSP